MSKTRKLFSSITLSPGTRLFSEDFFIAELAPFGMTRRSFRCFCRALSCPMLEIGTTRFVDILSFAICLRAILRVGSPDFLAPGSATLASGDHKKMLLPPATRLDPELLKRDWNILLTELLASRRISRLPNRREIVACAAEALDRIARVDFLKMSASEQDAYARRSLLVSSVSLTDHDLVPAPSGAKYKRKRRHRGIPDHDRTRKSSPSILIPALLRRPFPLHPTHGTPTPRPPHAR